MSGWTSEVIRLPINFGFLFVGCFASVNFYYIYEQIERNGRTIELRINYCYDGNIRYRIDRVGGNGGEFGSEFGK